MTLHLLDAGLFSLSKNFGNKFETNLGNQSGNGVLESLGDVSQGMEIVSPVGIHNTLGTHGSLVSLAVGVDFILRVFVAMKNPG